MTPPAVDGAGDPQRRVPERLDVRPLDRFRSFKVKLGILVAASVTVTALLTQVSIRAGVEPLLALPLESWTWTLLWVYEPDTAC